MRRVKLAVGAVLGVAAVYAIVGEQMAGTSADAVINAQVTTVRAPIDGDFTLSVRRLGSRLSVGEPLGTIRDPRPDETRLIDLRRAASAVEGDLDRLRQLTTELTTARAMFERQAQDYARGRVQQLEARLAEASSTLEAAQSRFREAEATQRRSTELSRSGVQTAVDSNRARAGFEVATHDVEGARNRVRYLSIEADAARRGTFLGDASTDVSHSQQRLRDLDIRLGEVAADTIERSRRASDLQAQIRDETVRLMRFREASMAAPAESLLWEFAASDGEYVRKSQDVIRLVDCSTTIVTASVRESVYDSLKVGDRARFRLRTDGSVHEGSVVRLAGSGAENIYRTLAVGPSAEHLKRFDVALVFPGLLEDAAMNCSVGRTGRVVFSARPLDFWRRLVSGLGVF